MKSPKRPGIRVICRLRALGLETEQFLIFSCWRSREVGKAGRTLDCKILQILQVMGNKALDLDIQLAYLLAVVCCIVVLPKKVDMGTAPLPNSNTYHFHYKEPNRACVSGLGQLPTDFQLARSEITLGVRGVWPGEAQL